MLYFDKIDISERIDINNMSASKNMTLVVMTNIVFFACENQVDNLPLVF